MKDIRVLRPSAEILSATDDLERVIESAGRTAWKSEDRATDDSAGPFIERLKTLRHESVLEHGAITVRVVCDRGVSHELVRHRIASYTQESTRYCNYGKPKYGGTLAFIRPPFWAEGTDAALAWEGACRQAQHHYLYLLTLGATPQEARAVLPNSLKTEIVITANPRSWRHIFRLRCDHTAHPQMREIMLPLRGEFAARWPAVFGDLLEGE